MTKFGLLYFVREKNTALEKSAKRVAISEMKESSKFPTNISFFKMGKFSCKCRSLSYFKGTACYSHVAIQLFVIYQAEGTKFCFSSSCKFISTQERKTLDMYNFFAVCNYLDNLKKIIIILFLRKKLGDY